jgi:hypothetical protein
MQKNANIGIFQHTNGTTSDIIPAPSLARAPLIRFPRPRSVKNTFFGTELIAFIIQGELAHCQVKRMYSRTNKRNVGPQIAAHERRGRILTAMNRRMKDAAAAKSAAAPADAQPTKVNNLHPTVDPLPRTPPRQHHHISESKRAPIDLYDFLTIDGTEEDPALEVCL